MSIVVAELETHLTANPSEMDAVLEKQSRKLIAFGEAQYPDARLGVNIDEANVKLKLLRKEFENTKKALESGITVGAGGGVGTAGLRPSTAKPEKIAATTAATVEQIERTSNARREAEAKRTSSAVESIETKSAARRAQIELSERQKTDTAVERQTLLAQERRNARLEQIEDEFWKRQDLKAQARANRPAPTLSQRARSLQNAGQQDVQTGMMLSGAVTAPLVAGGLLVTKAGIDWETAFTGVTKTVDGTKQELAALDQQLRGMASGKKAIPIDVEELAQIAEAAGQLGIKTPAIAGFTRVMADLGQTTNLTSSDAADKLARLANIVQMPQNQFDRLGSTIVSLGNKTAATESEIVNMGERLAGSGHQIGLTTPQILGFAAALSSVGVEAEMGGTAFQKFFVSVEQAVREGGKNLDLYAKVAGTTSGRFKQAFEKDASGAIISVIDGLGRMQKAGGNVFGTLDKLGLGSERVRDALLRAAGAGDLFSTSVKQGETAWRQNIALSAEAEKRYGTTAAQLQILQNRLKEQAIEISSRVLPVINKLIRSYGDDLPRAIGAAASVFESMPESAQKASLAGAGLLAMVGPAKILAGNIKLLGGAFTEMWAAALANPLLAVVAVAALAGGYLVLNKALSTVADAENQAKQSTEALNGSFKRMLEVLPDGSKQAVEIRKIRDEIAAAGTDVNKLDQAAQDLAKTRARLNIEIKNPDLALVMSNELNRAQATLDKQKLTATVIVRPFMEQVSRSITDTIGATSPDKPIWQMGDTDNSIVDWLMGARGDGTMPGGRIDPRAYDNSAFDPNGVSGALARGSANTRRLRAEAQAARAREAFNSFQQHNALITGQNPNPASSIPGIGGFGSVPQVTGRTASGESTFVTPGSVAVDATPAGVAAARQRLLNHKAASTSPAMPRSTATTTPPTFGGVSSSDSDKAAERAQRQTEARQRQEEAAERRREALLSAWRAKQAQSLEEGARPWQNLNETINQMGLHLVEFDAATDGARARARLLSKEFAGLPRPIQDATVQMATLLDQMDEMAKQRDGLRDNNAGTLSSLLRSGANISPFLRAIHNQEKTYDFSDRIGAARQRAGYIGSQLGPYAANEASSRSDRARQLREENDSQRFTPLGGEGGAPFKGVVSGDAVVKAAQDAANGAQPKFRQTCAWAVTQMYKSFGVEIETQNNNVAKNWVQYARKHWRQVDAATAPPGALLAEPSSSANSGWHVAMSRGGRYRAGSNVHQLQLGSAGSNAIAFIPPQLDPLRGGGTTASDVMPGSTAGTTTRTPKAPVGKVAAPSLSIGPSNLESPTRAKPGTGALLPYTEAELKALLRAWGPTITEGSERPGVSNQFRAQKQDELLNRLANGERLSPARVAADRAAANVADASSARAKASLDAKRATDELGRSTANQIKVMSDARQAYEASGGSMAAYERATYAAQKRIEAYSSQEVLALWNQKRFHEANALAAQQVAGAMAVYDNGKSNERGMAASRAATALADETATLNEQRDYLAQNAGKPEATIARGLDEISRKWQEYRRLIDEEGKDPAVAQALAAQTAAQQSNNAALSDAIELQRQLNAENAQRVEDQTAQNDEARLRGDGLNSRQRQREMAGLAAERAKAKELAGSNLDPDYANLLAWQAGQDARTKFDQDAASKRDDDTENARQSHQAQMRLLQAQRDKTGAFNSNDPELQIQLRLLERKNELELQNAQLDDSEKINVKGRLDDYEAELRAQEGLNRLTQERAAIQSAVEQTLSLQKEHELAMAKTAAERMAIEQRYDAMLRAQRGEAVSAEEEAEQAKQRVLATQNEQLDNAKAQAARVRDIIADTLKDGASKGVGEIMDVLKNAAFERVANKITKAIFGVDLLGQNGDILDILNGKNGQKPTAGAATAPAVGGPALSAIPSIVDGLKKHRDAQTAAGIDTAPASVKRQGLLGALGGLLGGDGGAAGGQIANATIHINHAVEHIQTATIHTNGSMGGFDNNSVGSTSSFEQVMNTFGLLS